MTRRPAHLASRRFDLLVVGGGIHGLCAACDAAQRGLSVALIERGDFGCGSSFNHLKTVHGGLRSLQTADVAKFRESVVERRAFARIAPHLVDPLGFLLPTMPKITRSRTALRVAFGIDAALGADRNQGVPPRLHLPRGRVIGRRELLDMVPPLEHSRATGGAIWYDYQMPRTDRLTLAFAHAAADAGAELANYVEAESALLENGSVAGVRARDTLTGESFDVRAAVTLNAAGAGAVPLVATFAPTARWPLQKALNAVTSRRMDGLALGAAHGSGTLFLVPWGGRLVIGTWHDDTPCEPNDLGVSPAELDRFVEASNAAFPWLRLGADEITLVHRGVVPAVAGRDGHVSMRNRPALIDHASQGVGGVLSIVGVKYTTGRAVAEHAVTAVFAKLGRQAPPSRSGAAPLPGAVENRQALGDALLAATPGLPASSAAHLAANYGTLAARVLDAPRDEPGGLEPLSPSHGALRAEVRHAVRQESACTLTDVVVRRLQLGAAGHPGDEAASRAAQEMQRECGWDDARTAAELRALRAFYAPVTRDGVGN